MAVCRNQFIIELGNLQRNKLSLECGMENCRRGKEFEYPITCNLTLENKSEWGINEG